MSDPAFDTLSAARSPQPAARSPQPAARSPHTQSQAQIDGLSGRIDSLRIEMRADIVRSARANRSPPDTLSTIMGMEMDRTVDRQAAFGV